eukprot:s644_g21.t1
MATSGYDWLCYGFKQESWRFDVLNDPGLAIIPADLLGTKFLGIFDLFLRCSQLRRVATCFLDENIKGKPPSLGKFVSAVFVQQTMKTATNDEELAFKQKERDTALYTRKVKKVFATMDKSGDGALNMEDFAKLVKSPKLKFWMSQLELEYHDLMSLFEFLDNGDGQITLTEFIEGAARLRGSAKALDVWRLETKVEVLFEEVVGMLRKVKNDDSDNGSECGSHIGDVFASSRYAHIKMTTGR